MLNIKFKIQQFLCKNLLKIQLFLPSQPNFWKDLRNFVEIQGIFEITHFRFRKYQGVANKVE